MTQPQTKPRQADHCIDPLFTRRWSLRAFTGETISEAGLLSFRGAARWAPSSHNAQPWRFTHAGAGTPSWEPVFKTLGIFNREWKKEK